ncbi:MAG: Csp1 family four helix bundle copper storage protein [Myxococcaceae bacterium]
MNRREVVLGGVGAAAVGLALRASAAEPPAPSAPAAGTAHAALIDSAFACIKVGQACQQHCLSLLAKGDATLAECATTIAAMLPSCEALAQLAVQNSPRLKALAVVCAQICRDCEKACRKHEMHHAICKACADSCAACAAECDKVQA